MADKECTARPVVDWKPYKAGEEIPPGHHGPYWLIIRQKPGESWYDPRPYVAIGTREYYGAMKYIWRTEDIGGCDDWVTHYAPFFYPAMPEGVKDTVRCTACDDGTVTGVDDDGIELQKDCEVCGGTGLMPEETQHGNR